MTTSISKYLGVTGRVATYINNPEKGTMPVSCTSYKYDPNESLFAPLKFIDIALRGGAGINVILDEFVSKSTQDKYFYFYLPENHPDFKDLTEQQKANWKYINNITDSSNLRIIKVEDSMEGSFKQNSFSIQNSWNEFIDILIDGLIPVIDLSNLRAKGTTNSVGLEASGPVSFLTIYEAILNHINKGDLLSFMQLCGQMNEVLRRGGQYKNGIVTFSLIYTHPEIVKYLNIPLAELPGSAKKGVRIDDGLKANKRIKSLIKERVNDKSLMLEKRVFKLKDRYVVGKSEESLLNEERRELYSNVCLTGDTLVLTKQGHHPIKNLVGREIEVWDGERWVTVNNFTKTGENKEVYSVQLVDGRTVKATAYHDFILEDNSRKKLYELELEDELKEHSVITSGLLTTTSAYLKGFLTAEGTTTNGVNPLLYIYSPKFNCISKLIESANESDLGVINTCAKSKIEVKKSGENRVVLQGLAARKESFSLWCSTYKLNLPLSEMLNWKDSYKYEFIAGVMDGDGSVLSRLSTGNPLYTITSIHLEWLENFQILLQSIGVSSRISLHEQAKVKDFGSRGGECLCKTSWRLVFNADASYKLSNLVKFYRLPQWNNISPKTARPKTVANAIKSIELIGVEDVYCCTVPTTNAFALSNGIIVGNCREILFDPKGTCLLLHENLAQITTLDELTPAFEEGMTLLVDLFNRWKSEVGSSASQYLSNEEDKQVGLGVFGLANLLKHLGITYKQHVLALEAYLNKTAYDVTTIEWKLAEALVNAYQAAANIAKEAGLERAFTIAPTQSCAYRYTDLKGNTACKNIYPPLAARVRRTSYTVKELAKWYYHGEVETIQSVVESESPEFLSRLVRTWQALMNTTGMAHSISHDLYYKIDEEWLDKFINNPNDITVYYNFYDKVNQNYLNKGTANVGISESKPTGVCAIDNPSGCVSCGE